MTMKDDLNKINKKVNETSFAMEMLQFSKEQTDKTSKRMFIIIIILIISLICSISYSVYLLNNIGEISTTEKSIDIQEFDSIDNSDIGNY